MIIILKPNIWMMYNSFYKLLCVFGLQMLDHEAKYHLRWHCNVWNALIFSPVASRIGGQMHHHCKYYKHWAHEVWQVFNYRDLRRFSRPFVTADMFGLRLLKHIQKLNIIAMKVGFLVSMWQVNNCSIS